VAFLPGSDFLSSPSAIREAITNQDPADYLPTPYSTSPSLLRGYEAQRALLQRAISSRNSTLIETPLAGDPYALLILQKPLSRGTITIDPSDPFDGAPLVDFNTLRNPVDMQVLRESIRFTRRLYATTAMAVLGPEENAPGTDAESDERLEQYIRRNAGGSIGHESGTCAMLPQELGGVVDAELRVYGVTGLSVVDASVMPLVPSTNLCATVYAVAEKAADLIKRRHGERVRIRGGRRT
jgi:choline dehydrogenase-like flavoprotein